MRSPRLSAALAIALSLVGCTKKSQSAVVLEKEYIPARVEGAELKERQLDREQWLVRVEMADGRKATASLDEAEWKTFQVGDRVRADYSQGNYTGTVWVVEIHKP